MDIACPKCEAAYEIDDASVTVSGRKVRCAACSTVWRVFPIGYDGAPQEAAPQSAPVEISPDQGLVVEQTDIASQISANAEQENQRDNNAPPRARRVKWAKESKADQSKVLGKHSLLPWHSGAIAATVIILGLAIYQRERIVQILPQTSKIFATLGIPVNLRGIEIKGVSSRIIDDNGVFVLIVDGDLSNITGQKLDVPRLRFAVRGQDGQEVYVWSAQADRNSLQPGETLNFRRRLAAPPTEGKDVSVRFVNRSDITAGIK